MPTIAEQRQAALDQLTLLIQPEGLPTLDVVLEVAPILDRHQRASLWAIGTAYDYGKVVIPTVRNGHRYRCVQAGTSGATLGDEPTWPLAQAGQVSDGTSDPILVWAGDGPDWENVFDVSAAAHECWMIKASKAAKETDFWIGQQRIDESQLIEHCLKMAGQFAPVGIT